MDQNTLESFKAKDEPISYEDSSIVDLKSDILDQDDVLKFEIPNNGCPVEENISNLILEISDVLRVKNDELLRAGTRTSNSSDGIFSQPQSLDHGVLQDESSFAKCTQGESSIQLHTGDNHGGGSARSNRRKQVLEYRIDYDQILNTLSENDDLTFELESRAPSSTLSNTTPEEMQFVDPADVVDISTTRVKVEDADPLLDIKQEPNFSLLVDEQRPNTDIFTESDSCVREQSTAPVTRPCFVRLERLNIHGELKMHCRQMLDDGQLQLQSAKVQLSQSKVSDVEKSKSVSSLQESAEGTDFSIHPITGDDQQQDSSRMVPRHDVIERNHGHEQCVKRYRKKLDKTALLENTFDDHPVSSNNYQKKSINNCHWKPNFDKHNTKRLFCCSQCDKRFKHKISFSSHLRSHRGDRPYQCSYCDHRFKQKGHLGTHLMSHTGDRPFQCSGCDKSFIQKSNLIKHLISHSADKPYKCTQCEKSYKVKSVLSIHLKLHTGDRPFQCSQCEKTFTNNFCLKSHMRLHTGDLPYQCSRCDKRFIHKSSLSAHLLTHIGVKPFQCSHCDKRFTDKSSLNVHLRIHKGYRPYHCFECDKQFTQRSTLICHLRVHTGDRPYRCSVCDKGFTQYNVLKNHSRKHTGERPYECGHCVKKFTRKHLLIIHLRLHGYSV